MNLIGCSTKTTWATSFQLYEFFSSVNDLFVADLRLSGLIKWIKICLNY